MKSKKITTKHLSTKIIFIITPVIFIILVLFAFVIYGALKHSLLDYAREELKEEMERVRSELRLVEGEDLNPRFLNYLFQDAQVIATIRPGGEQLEWLNTDFTWLEKAFSGFAFEKLDKGFEVIEPQSKTHFFLRSFSIMDKHFVVIKNLTTVYHGLRELTYILVAVVPLIIVLMNSFIIYVINNTLRPIRTTIKTAQMITAQNLSRRIQEPVSEDEIGQLVYTLNQMIDRLEKGYRRIYNFTGNVAHELRTPLTIISGELELAIKKERNPEIRGWMQNIYEETQFLKKMINRLLLLTRLENKLIEPEFYEINLTNIVKRCVHRYELLANEKKLQLNLNGECHSTIFGDETLLEELIGILLENAIKYSEPEGDIDIDFVCKDSQCRILIRDNCKEKISHWHGNLFKRFRSEENLARRKDAGLGIGLSIAKEIVDFHQGHIFCIESPPMGCTFTIALPLAIYEEDDHP